MKYQKKFRINDNPKKIHLRVQIIKGYLNGKSLTEIARSEKCTIKTVRNWVNRYKQHISKKPNLDSPNNKEIDKDFEFRSLERKRRLSIPYKVQRYIIGKCNNKSTGGKDGISLNYLLSQINFNKRLRKKLNFQKKICKTTLHNFIRAHFGKPYKIRKKPYFKREHLVKRKKFADYIIENNIKGSDIFFTDEKIFLIDFFPNKQTNQIRLSDDMKKKLRQGKEKAENLLSKKVPKKSRGFMVAGGVSKQGVGKLIFCIGTVDSFAYKQAIKSYQKDIDFLSPENKRLFFQQDNAPSHTAKDVKEILKNMKSLSFWPPNSPEISPIEKVWSFILRKLEGIKFDNIDNFKKKVLFIWNRIPKEYCEKIINKFDEDILLLAKNGGHIKTKIKSSYKPYKLESQIYEDHFENIIYNKEKMVTKLNKELNSIQKEIRNKTKIINKINTKAFFSFVVEEIKKKMRTAMKHIIEMVLKEEIRPYQLQLDSLKEKNESLTKFSLETYFNKLPQLEKEKMIDISPKYDTETLDESIITKEESETIEIKNIIDKPFKREKEFVRPEVKRLILNKINEKRKKKI